MLRPTKTNRMANRVKTPSTSGPTKRRRRNRYRPEEQPQKGDSHPHEAHGVDGQVGKAGHQVEIEAEELEQAVLGLAPLPLGVAHGNLRHPSGVEVGQGRDEAGGLLALVDGVDHLPAVGPQHAAVVPQMDPGDLRHDDVNQVRGELAEDGVPAVLPPAAHGVVAFLQFGHQAGNLLRRVLQVRVQGDHHLAPGRLEAGKDGLVLAEIAVELQGPQVFRILIVQFGEEVPGAVVGAVVHQDDLEGAPHGGSTRIRRSPNSRRFSSSLKTGIMTEISGSGDCTFVPLWGRFKSDQ